tara:strand:- start:4861 stop:4962 length:102 start_codon:yes stop_codon:yes gene_type:complete
MENFKTQKEAVVFNMSFEKPTGYKNINATGVKK